eukprot:1161649-Pelagomonas_calceolata.AAC.4
MIVPLHTCAPICCILRWALASAQDVILHRLQTLMSTKAHLRPPLLCLGVVLAAGLVLMKLKLQGGCLRAGQADKKRVGTLTQCTHSAHTPTLAHSLTCSSDTHTGAATMIGTATLAGVGAATTLLSAAPRSNPGGSCSVRLYCIVLEHMT